MGVYRQPGDSFTARLAAPPATELRRAMSHSDRSSQGDTMPSDMMGWARCRCRDGFADCFAYVGQHRHRRTPHGILHDIHLLLAATYSSMQNAAAQARLPLDRDRRQFLADFACQAATPPLSTPSLSRRRRLFSAFWSSRRWYPCKSDKLDDAGIQYRAIMPGQYASRHVMPILHAPSGRASMIAGILSRRRYHGAELDTPWPWPSRRHSRAGWSAATPMGDVSPSSLSAAKPIIQINVRFAFGLSPEMN